MGHQIRFFCCAEMLAAIAGEARRISANLVESHSDEPSAIQLSQTVGSDVQQGRLWTDAEDLTHYDSLCRAVKKSAAFDRESGLWVKRTSRAAFDTYRNEKMCALAALEERNRKYAIDSLGGRPTK
jgi:hypothetical protein